jgi:hypothetical protein
MTTTTFHSEWHLPTQSIIVNVRPFCKTGLKIYIYASEYTLNRPLQTKPRKVKAQSNEKRLAHFFPLITLQLEFHKYLHGQCVRQMKMYCDKVKDAVRFLLFGKKCHLFSVKTHRKIEKQHCKLPKNTLKLWQDSNPRTFGYAAAAMTIAQYSTG